MKIYFDGCSWTKGAELENEEEERFSKVLCNELGAEEHNLAVSGGSNDRIVRNLIVEHNIEDYDLAVVQMTYPVRTEFYNDSSRGGDARWYKHPKQVKDDWSRVNPKQNYSDWLREDRGPESIKLEKSLKRNPSLDMRNTKDPLHISRLGEKFTGHHQFWRYYYMHVTNAEFFKTKEKIHYQTIKNHCEVKKVPLILLSINKWTELPFDLQLDDGTRNMRHKKGHPTKELHSIFARKIKDMFPPSLYNI